MHFQQRHFFTALCQIPDVQGGTRCSRELLSIRREGQQSTPPPQKSAEVVGTGKSKSGLPVAISHPFVRLISSGETAGLLCCSSFIAVMILPSGEKEAAFKRPNIGSILRISFPVSTSTTATACPCITVVPLACLRSRNCQDAKANVLPSGEKHNGVG